METNKYWNRTDIASGIGMSACGRIPAVALRATKGHVGLPVAFTTVPGTNAWSPPVC